MSPPFRKTEEPFTIEEAVDDEQAFWRRVGEVVAEKIQETLREPLSELRSAILDMKVVARSQRVVVERLNRQAEQLGNVTMDVSRIAGWTTAKSLTDEQLNRRIERLLELLTPPLPPPTPPNETPP